MTSYRPLAADALERLIEARIISSEELYELDGETFMRTRDGRVETGTASTFEAESF